MAVSWNIARAIREALVAELDVCELLAAEVQAAFEAARRAGPPPAWSLRQARWFLAPEARDVR